MYLRLRSFEVVYVVISRVLNYSEDVHSGVAGNNTHVLIVILTIKWS